MISQAEISNIIENFHGQGVLFEDGKRNKIKIFDIGGIMINVKSFKIPNLFNKIAYRYFRKSKAKRSFEYANYLIKNGIGTPQPIAFFERFNALGLQDSYYMSEHLSTTFTFRELVTHPEYHDHENILRQHTRFSYLLHQKGIEFKDHSPGNTLIVNNNGIYSFYLVDLNRMSFHQNMPFDLRMKNLSRLTPHQEMIRTMSNEYSKLSGEDEQQIFETLWRYTSEFQHRYYRKKRIKKKLLFWK